MSGAMRGRQRHLLGQGVHRDVDAAVDHDQVVDDASFVIVEALDDLLLERAQSFVGIKLSTEIIEQLECRDRQRPQRGLRLRVTPGQSIGDGVGGARLVLNGEVKA
jgi:hypothetical protein